ncbi:hypothetical protein PsAD2_03991 [Pseudovibrio axinellae]|uniref:Uncharacterized protein n=1 Tax=Pseudovibrio axinellae TaxID=989403 RepID=A0A165U9L7_9HYPH|nr:hypothetical protein PsAD2_03991 [Pseudovibrio axinellae]
MFDGRRVTHHRCNGGYSQTLLIPSGKHALGPFARQHADCGQPFLIEGSRPVLVTVGPTGKQLGQLDDFLIFGIGRPRLNGGHQTCARRVADTISQTVIAITRSLIVFAAAVAHDFPSCKIRVDQPTNSLWSQH